MGAADASIVWITVLVFPWMNEYTVLVATNVNVIFLIEPVPLPETPVAEGFGEDESVSGGAEVDGRAS